MTPYVIAVIRPGEYHDSVVLMQASERLRAADGILEALVVMGTPSNKAVLEDLGLLTPEAQHAKADDLILAVKARDAAAAQAALAQQSSLLAPQAGAPERAAPQVASLDAAIAALPGANLALISVPGPFAAAEARRALRRGLHALVFSDNVPLAEEIALKELGRQQGLLVMGPDCGVCNLTGAALGLASIVRPGPVGIVGASGSGTQEVAALLEAAGVGVAQAIGTGGRDLRDAVGGATMRAGLAALAADPAVRVIVLVGKEPGAAVLPGLLSDIRQCARPVVTCFLGADPAAWSAAGAYVAPTMDAAAQLAGALAAGQAPAVKPFMLAGASVAQLAAEARARLAPPQRYLRGLFGGGTFVAQAQVLLKGLVGPIHSNSPFAGGIPLADPRNSQGHTLLDLGDEALTHGRAHPVIDPLPYRLRIAREFQDPEVAVLLFDVILGPGAHPDPAGFLAAALAEARAASGRDLVTLASVCGTPHDPQNAIIQRQKLVDAAVLVLPSSAQAVRMAAAILQPELLARWAETSHPAARLHRGAGELAPPPPQVARLLSEPVRVVNVGAASLAQALELQKIPVIGVAWRPPAGGNPAAARLLAQLQDDAALRLRIETANRQAYDTFVNGQPVWLDVCPAGEVVPGFRKNLILHTGPRLPFDRMIPAQQSGIVGGILFEGLASSRAEALDLIRSGRVELAPGINYGVPGGGMAPTTFSMPVAVAEDTTHGTRGFAALQEGPSYEALRWGVYNDVVAERWRWFRDVFGPALSAALRTKGGINLRTVIARSLQMGDENHSRELGSSLLLLAELAPHLSRLALPTGELARCFEFLLTAERFALHVLMAGATSVLRAAEGIQDCTVVTAMGGNGVEIGIKVSGLGQDWFTAPSPLIRGRYLNPSWKPEDTVPFAGDSCAVEVYGLGGLAAGASPAVTMLAGGTVDDALARTREMWTITVGKNPHYAIPALGFQGTPTGVDMLKVLETGTEPQSHAGIILKQGGQAGAGVARIPMACFSQALAAFAERLGLR